MSYKTIDSISLAEKLAISEVMLIIFTLKSLPRLDVIVVVPVEVIGIVLVGSGCL